jgi:hypothetical protein
LASVSNCNGAERIDAETSGAVSMLSGEAGDVRIATLALASYWLGAIRQYRRHSSSNPPTTENSRRRLRTKTCQSSRREVEELCRLLPALGPEESPRSKSC